MCMMSVLALAVALNLRPYPSKSITGCAVARWLLVCLREARDTLSSLRGVYRPS